MAKQLIPDEILIPAAEATNLKFGRGDDLWCETHRAYCREVCGEGYEHIETDWIQHRVTNLRKKGVIASVLGGAKRKKKEVPEGEYAEYLKSQHWLQFRLTVLAFWNGECCLCTSKACDVHHRHYRTVGHERLTDCVPLCRKCHTRVHGVMASGNEAMNESDEHELF
jgi:5-methylcytosine-specific restriction endonuclease McrA